MTYKINSMVQGSDEWNTHRAGSNNASELFLALGYRMYGLNRTMLIRKMATGISPEITRFQKKIFDDGHRYEALARPLAEQIIGKELYPITVSKEVVGLSRRLSASLDGSTEEGENFEHKSLNDDLSASLDIGVIPEEYWPQMEQGMFINGATRTLFMASKWDENDNLIEEKHCWYESNPELRAKIIPAWLQAEEEAANYRHVDPAPVPVAEVIEDLPALTVQLVGQVTSSNLATFQSAVLARVKSINTTLVTDQDFANADKMVKFLDDGEKRLDLVKAQALAQTESIDQLFRAIDSLKAEMRSKRLTLDRLVKSEKESRKTEIVMKAGKELGDYVVALQQRVGVQFKPEVSNFGEVIKGLKSLDSMRDKVSVALAHAKIKANEIADLVEFNRSSVEDMSLFPDFIQVCTKPADDFAALLAMRVAQRKEADEKRIEAEREKIRSEERDRTLINAEQRTRLLDEQARAMRDVFCRPETNKDSLTTGSTIKLGEICTRLGFTVTADFLAHIGFPYVTHDKNAKLYRATDFPDMCKAIAAHVLKAGSVAQRAE